MIVRNENGITIRELKDFINSLPDKDEYGDDYEVWISNTDNDSLSNVAKEICTLNRSDIILSIC